MSKQTSNGCDVVIVYKITMEDVEVRYDDSR